MAGAFNHGQIFMQPSLILETTAYTPEQLSGLTVPQAAFAGRSNVGKSSLLNALAGTKKLARISSSPGKTRSINFYRVNPGEFFLVDLPGYGYAKCAKKEKEAFGRLIEAYLEKCENLKALILLLDCRLPPQQLDMNLASYARHAGIFILPVLTKADKCSQKERSETRKSWQIILGGPVEPIAVSSTNGLGVATLWQEIYKLFEFDELLK